MLSLGLDLLSWKNRRKWGEYPFSVLYFHRVLSEASPFCPDDPQLQYFESLMTKLKKYYSIYSLSQALALQKSHSLPKRSLVITFDDGYIDNYTNALPVFEKLGLKASFFIATQGTERGYLWNDQLEYCLKNTTADTLTFEGQSYALDTTANKADAYLDIVGKIKFYSNDLRDKAVDNIEAQCGRIETPRCMMTAGQLQQLVEKGHDIGAHTVTHSILGVQSDEVCKNEIVGSIQYLEKTLGIAPTLFAYPNGWFGRDFYQPHEVMVKDAGIDYAVATNDGGVTSNSRPMALPRFMPHRKEFNQFCLSIVKIAGEDDASAKV